MKLDIQDKIRQVLYQDSYFEKDIVYFLVEAYKFLENDGRQNEYELIRFYRDWAVHARLDRKNVSKIFGDSIDSISELETIDNPYEHLDYSFRVEEKIKNCFKPYSLNFLRNEIKNLLEEISYEGKFKWESFREGIYEVIRDIPLVIEKDGQHILSFRCIKLSDKTKINFNDISLAVLVKGGDSFYIDSNDDIIEKDEFIPRSR